jgi:hypothetical protein
LLDEFRHNTDPCTVKKKALIGGSVGGPEVIGSKADSYSKQYTIAALLTAALLAS